MASFKPVLGIGLLAWLASGELWATDGYRELQITQDIDARTSPGEVVRLQASGLEFQGLYREAVSKNVRGAVVLLHGRDSNQDAADLIRPLRRGLPEHGWNTLSLAMPIAVPDDLQGQADLVPEAIVRLQSGITYLKEKNIGTIALLAHDTGAWGTLRYLADAPDNSVKGAVLIDPAPVGELDVPPISAGSLRAISLPILEILSRRISVSVNDEASRKRTVMKANPSYQLLVLNEPHRGWQDSEDFLLNRIHGWLSHLQASAVSITATPAETRTPSGNKQE
ncbi:DUF3530 family protein [Methylocaldum szegediense]|nr:DUF3530 family protein [Methylocaldum szegediense]